MQKEKFKYIFSFQKKSKIKAGDGLKLGDGTYPFYTSSNVLTKSLNEYLFEQESLIFGTGGLASIHHCNEKFAVSTDCFVTQPIDSKKVYPKFIYYFLSGNIHILENGFKGAGLKHISKDYLENIEIPLPALPTQQKIASILDKADELRQYNQQLIEKYDALTQSLFLDMFGDPVKNEKGWSLVPADKHIDLLTGFAFKSELYSKNPNHIRICGGLIIMPWGIEWSKSNRWDLSNSINLDKYQLKIDDIVMAMDRPWIGSGFKIAQIKKEDLPSLLVQRTARIRSNDFNPKFLFHFYNSLGFEKHAKPTETTVPHISPKDIKSYLLFDVPIELQNQFAERITLIEVQKQQAQEALAKSELLFQGLLQQAFNGELN